MNYYWNKLMSYHEIHQLSRVGYSISRIAEYTNMDWRTIKKYLHMTEQEYEIFIDQSATRKRKLDPYEAYTVGKLREFPDTSTAQLHDWLREHHSDFPEVSAKTVFNFGAHLRQKYQGIHFVVDKMELNILGLRCCIFLCSCTIPSKTS